MANVHNASAVAQRALDESQTGFLTGDYLYALRVMASALAYIASQGIAGRQAWQGLNERFDRALWNGASDDAAPQAKS